MGGLTLLKRREIYASCHAAGMKAVSTADARYPFDEIPTDSESARTYLFEREKLYKAARAKGRNEVAEQYEIEAECLDAIDEEGDREKWPLWDGLSDEHGPIPAFGPALTNDIGQVLMSDDEREARRDAALRALSAIGKITDETDTDEVWAEVFRGLEGDS